MLCFVLLRIKRSIIIIFEKGLKSQKILCKMPCFYRKMSAKIFKNNNRFSHLSVLNLWANTIHFTHNVGNYVKTMVFYTLNFFDFHIDLLHSQKCFWHSLAVNCFVLPDPCSLEHFFCPKVLWTPWPFFNLACQH